MRVLVIGAGSLGGQFAAHLARSGVDISILDTDPAIVGAATQHGLIVDGAFGRHEVDVPAFSDASAAVVDGLYDAVFLHVDSNNTGAAGTSARTALKPEGFCLQIQNGIGNVETLQSILGEERVLGGSTMCSAANNGPAKPLLTHHGPTSIGEWNGGTSTRAKAAVALFVAAGYDAVVDTDIQTKIWSKAILNAAINPLCAASGLRLGEMARTPEMNALQDNVLRELFAVVNAKGVGDNIDAEDLTRQIKAHSMSKFSRPSMMQAVEAGKQTEIDALNNRFVAEGAAAGLSMPYNESVVAFMKGVERTAITRRKQPESVDQAFYDKWEEQEIAAGTAGQSPMLSARSNDYSLPKPKL